MDITTLAVLLGGIQQIEEKIKTVEKEGFKVQVEENKDILNGVGEEKIFYFIPKDVQAPKNGYDEYIYANNKWELIGGTDVDLNYELLDNKPQINGHILNGNLNFSELGISNVTLRAYNPPFWVSSLNAYNVGDIWVNDSTKISFILKSKDGHNLTWAKLGVQSYVSDTIPPAFEKSNDKHLLYSAGDIWIHRDLHNSGSTKPYYILLGLYVCIGSARQSTQPTNQYNITWQRIDNKVLSGVVNQNGTITFTNSDGSTFTTSGSSVIGADGQDYVLTAQDKIDIADIVLSKLPTIEGIEYGN